ncbi:DUF3617 domain-containing protein [Comamonas flocculans]|uniref:DUF3617 domain-containing protein n=1 Tax=Comamonas flocculans TaxID=2597701 RepID=A0A5B8RVS3_9BURK|nr:DUF3617 domain-containing protein [Comamonas flocculans]QEA12828.1 DUF3617 domain-containing protein [Comamonas flocculans]
MTAMRALLTLLLLALGSSLALAQDIKLKPGLWEVQGSMKTSSGRLEAAMAQMQAELAKMPPEQRRQMEQMMRANGMGAGGNAMNHTVKICMTQKDVDLDQIKSSDDCTHKVRRSGPKTLQMSFQCTGSDGSGPSSGEGTVNLDSPTAYRGQYKMRTTADGQPEQMDFSQQGKWLSADCGKVKPLGQQ